ncbi:EI24 domain-containing protein [Erythrobacter mangrovi]|uniref:EI24 domain-containing protein n=1 Tax=Erythrobacter mangrovi TaxID=2739433 RepID=A0A7D3XHY0_9SPHN|nr:EI24 domain-containing protein [Erythrobacter mangrovi]QKG70859.1 EI24 domain-containing protein [Erythrobacter mangrovi]
MMTLFRALGLAIGQLGDPAILRVLGKSMAVTAAIFVIAGAILWWGLNAAIGAWLTTALPDDYGTAAAGIVALAIALVGGWLLFRFVALAVLQFFADEVVRAVEQRHYPLHAANARELPFAEEFSNSFRATGRALLVNLLVLPVALALLITGVGTALVFWAANAFLLGRELQDMVWLRHRQGAGEIAPIGGPTRFALGGIVAALLAVPLVNLLAPIIGAASATHLVHRAKREPIDA